MREWVPLFQTILWVVLILGFVIFYRKLITNLFKVIIRKVELIKNVRIGPVIIESFTKQLYPIQYVMIKWGKIGRNGLKRIG